MTNLIGIDFGLKKVGFSIAVSKLAEPLLVFRYKSHEDLIRKIKEICQKEKIEKIIVGVSEGAMRELSIKFSGQLKDYLKIPVEIFDETLTTHDAQKLAIASGMGLAKRKALEDAFAATIMLQSYLDN